MVNIKIHSFFYEKLIMMSLNVIEFIICFIFSDYLLFPYINL